MPTKNVCLLGEMMQDARDASETRTRRVGQLRLRRYEFSQLDASAAKYEASRNAMEKGRIAIHVSEIERLTCVGGHGHSIPAS